MAGTLTISTLSDGTNSTSSTNCIQGSAKAWVNYNASTQTVRASYNVSSVTYIGTGNYRVNFTTAFSDANYAVTGIANYVQPSSYLAFLTLDTAVPQTTTGVTIYVAPGAGGGGTANPAYVNLACFR